MEVFPKGVTDALRMLGTDLRVEAMKYDGIVSISVS